MSVPFTNDVFGFFVNGTNVALLPNGTVVSLHTVNLSSNPSYFINNDPNMGAAHLNTSMYGLTTRLNRDGCCRKPGRNQPYPAGDRGCGGL